VQGQPVTFLLTDNQIVNEKFLVFMNDVLSTGLISDLCAPEDVENFSNSVRAEAKAAGLQETPENLWDFFIEKIRRCAAALGRVQVAPCSWGSIDAWFMLCSMLTAVRLLL
jgi:P-loop containing dynein motor region D4